MKRPATVLFVVTCLVLAGTAAHAQNKKTAKQAESLEKSGEDAKAAVDDVLGHVERMLQDYNAIIDGTAEDPQSSYKKLAGDLKNTDKKIDGASKKLAALEKEAQKFFAAWEADLDSFSSESMRAKSQKRLDAARARYDSLGEVLREAGDAFGPFLENLNDQILYLGRDLSPDSIADLTDEAAELNAQAEDVTAQVKQMLDDAGEVESPMEGGEG